MGILIVCKGADFSACAVDKVDVPAIPECEHEYDNACDTTCNLCGATRTAPHHYVDGFCVDCGMRSPDNPYTIAEYPVQDGLQGLYDLGGTDSVVNAALNPTVSPVGGTATFDFSGGGSVSDDYATFTGMVNKSRLATYLRLPLANKITAVVLFRVPTGQNTNTPRPLISNRSGGQSVDALGVTLSHKGVLFAAAGDTYEQPTTLSFTPIEDDNKFAILVLSVAPEGLQVYRYTNGGLNNLVNYTEKTLNGWTTGNSGNALIFGGAGNSNGGNSVDISLASVHTGKLTDAQLEQVCRFVYNYGTQKGLTIE